MFPRSPCCSEGFALLSDTEKKDVKQLIADFVDAFGAKMAGKSKSKPKATAPSGAPLNVAVMQRVMTPGVL